MAVASVRQAVAVPWADLTVWLVDLDDPALEALDPADLASDEHLRADRFHFEHDRRRFLRARGVLRELLASELHCAPRDILLHIGLLGKPELLEPPRRLHFNISHSENLALLALSRVMPVGVDLERRRTVKDLPDLARGHFTAQEAEGLLSTPADEQLPAFLRVWTRKEACLKAWGVGLEWPGREFDVGLGGRRVVRPPRGRAGAVLRLSSLTLPENLACEAAVSLGMHDAFR